MTLAPEEAQHMRGVLRLKPNDEVYVFDGEGLEYRCRIESLRRDAATLSVIESIEPASPESALDLRLAISLLKGEKFDLAVQKATELGVMRVVPLMTRLSDIRLRDSADAEKRTTRWRRIALEAAKQSGRARLPLINEPTSFESLLESLSTDKDEAGFMFAEHNGQGILEALENPGVRPQALTALVGPEGGWTSEEIEEARAAGLRIITLGGRILRAETAAIAVTALLQHLFGDLR